LLIKEPGLEVNDDKNKYVVMTRDKNAERSNTLKIDVVPLKGWKSSNMWEQL